MGRKKIPYGTPCRHGHPYERRATDGECLACRRLQKREQRKKKVRTARARAEADWAYLASKKLKCYPAPRATRAELAALWERQGGRCGLTGARIPEGLRPHVDHIVPVSVGGASTIDNLHFTHPMANHAKNGSSVEEFRAWLLAAADGLRRKTQLEALC